jgi:MFS family permease
MAQSGMNLGWTSPVIPNLSRNDSFLPNLDPDGEEVSWITSLMPLGAILGAVPSGKAADKIGRKLAIGITAMPFLICWVLMLLAPLGASIPLLYVARFVGGIGAGAACVLVPVYIGEIAEPSIRGTLGTFFPIFFSLGIVFSYTAGSYLSYMAFNGCCCALLVPFLVSVVIFLPESPSWLVQRGRKADAYKVLRLLRGANYDVSQEIGELLEESEQLQVKEGGLRDLLGTKAGRKAIGTCVGLMWFQQMCGIDAVLFYTVQIFEEAKSSIDPNVATIIIGIIEVIMGLIVAVTIDRYVRELIIRCVTCSHRFFSLLSISWLRARLRPRLTLVIYPSLSSLSLSLSLSLSHTHIHTHTHTLSPSIPRHCPPPRAPTFTYVPT